MRGLALLATAWVMLLLPTPRLLAQKASTMTVTYATLLPSAPTPADFATGRVMAGYADVVITSCGRTRCQVRMSAVSPTDAGVTSLRYVVTASLPSVASCASALSTLPVASAPLVLDLLVTETTGAARVYFCYDLSWTGTPPATWTPGVRFQLQQGQ